MATIPRLADFSPDAGGGGGGSGVKTTALTALTGANIATGDLFDIVDISDTSMAGSGTNKKLEAAELLAYLQSNGMPRACRQTASDTNASNTTLEDVPGLAFTVVSGRRYFFRFRGTYSSAATTTGIGFAFTGPSITNFCARYRMQQGAAGTDQYYEGTSMALGTVVVNASVIAASTEYGWEIEGVIQPSANGTLQLQYRSEVNTSTITINNTGLGYITDCG